MEWTYEKIRQWAPNALLLNKGRQLASSRKWSTPQSDGSWIWGECKSTGTTTYATIVKLDGHHSRCSCQESYVPCRHAIALLWLMLRKPELINTASQLPSPFQKLRDRPPPSSPTQEQALARQHEREKRLQRRLELMQEGVEELEQWLTDLVRQGLSALEELPWSYWERTAARMTDAQLSGIARRLRQLPSVIGQERWHERLLEIIAELHLFVQAFRQIDGLTEPLQQEVLAIGGISQKKEQLLSLEGLNDNWLVIGIQTGEEDQLHYRRSWMLGENSGKAALILDYSYGRQVFEYQWELGSAWQAELVYYPGSFPLRGLVKNATPHRQPLEHIKGFASLQQFVQSYAEAVAANPWLYTFPALLEAVSFHRQQQQPLLYDQEGHAIPLRVEEVVIWRLAALSGGQSLAVFGEWDGAGFMPLSVLQSGRVIPLQSPEANVEEELF